MNRAPCHIARTGVNTVPTQHIALICYTLTRGSSCDFHVSRQVIRPAQHAYTVDLNSAFIHYTFSFRLRLKVDSIQHTAPIHAALQVTVFRNQNLAQFCVAQFLRFCLFFLFLKGRVFCIVAASYGHVSLIVHQLDWQCCRFPLLHRCGVVLVSLVSRCET